MARFPCGTAGFCSCEMGGLPGRNHRKLKGGKVMKRNELKPFRERLLAIRARLRGDVDRMRDPMFSCTSRLTRMPIHAAETAGSHYDAEMNVHLMVTKEEILAAAERQGRVLGVLLTIGLTGFAAEMFRIARHTAAGENMDWEQWSFIGWPLSRLVDGWSLTDRGRVLVRIFHECDLLVAEAVVADVSDEAGFTAALEAEPARLAAEFGRLPRPSQAAVARLHARERAVSG